LVEFRRFVEGPGGGCPSGEPHFFFETSLAKKQKVKTHKATARRFQYSGGGKLLRTRHGKSHLRRNRSRRAKREYDEMQPVSSADTKRVRRLMPYAN
jgi:large subunit ribosomal protein L35